MHRSLAALALAVAFSLACGSCARGDAPSPELFTPIPERGAPDGGDAGTPDGSQAACDPTKPFGVPVPIPALNTDAKDLLTDMSPDELTAYVATNRDTPNVHVVYATRASVSDAFGALMPLLPAGAWDAGASDAGAWDDLGVAVSADGLTAIVSSNRGGSSDLYVATRPNAMSSFGALGAAAAINGPRDEEHPKWSADGKTLYFDSTRTGSRDVYRSAVIAGSFDVPQAIGELNSPEIDGAPVLSPDELTIYFTSLRAPTPDGDIYVATRAKKTDAFSAPKVIEEVNSKGVDVAGFVSADGCRLYLSSTRAGVNYDVYVATRPP